MALLAVLSILWGCSRLPNVQGEGDPLFQGVWVQDLSADTSGRLSYTSHQIKFTCDSFYLSLVTYSKVNYYEEVCFNNGVWKEYAKGTYKFSGDTLSLSGVFTKANFKQKISGCYRNGRYFHQFLVQKKSDSTLAFNGIQEKSQFVINKKDHIDCVPQPL